MPGRVAGLHGAGAGGRVSGRGHAAAVTVWIYPRCTVVDVHDGDTLFVDIDLGQDLWVRRRSVRLSGIAARELSEPGGKEARDFLRSWLPTGTLVSVESTGWDKWAGRIDGVVHLPDSGTVQQRLLDAGFAAVRDGRGAQPKPPWPIPVSSAQLGARGAGGHSQLHAVNADNG